MIAPTLVELVVPIDTVRPFQRNPRRGNLDAIKQSLQANGQYRPIVVNRRTGEALAGNHTLAAALELGWTEIAATFVDVDDEQAARIVLVDNRSNDLAGYDDRELAELLQSLPDLDGTAWDSASLDQLLASLGSSTDDSRDTEPGELPAQPRAALGELYALGDHRLLCGDATDPAAVARLLDGTEPVLLVTDPPYGIELDMEWRDRAGRNTPGPAAPSYMRHLRKINGQGRSDENATISGDTEADWSNAFELAPSLRIAYVWHAAMCAVEVAEGLRRIGFQLAAQIIWDKQKFVLSRSHYHWQHEPCWYARRSGSPRWRGSRDQTTIWSVPPPKMIMSGSREERVDHPTQKPVELYVRPIRNHLARGAALYDPFVGSGTAIIAAENLGRRCYALEIDPRYVDVIVDRWQRHTGQHAELVEPAVAV